MPGDKEAYLGPPGEKMAANGVKKTRICPLCGAGIVRVLCHFGGFLPEEFSFLPKFAPKNEKHIKKLL